MYNRGMSQQAQAAPRITGPRSSEFVFARVRYDSGDWDYNPKVAANILNSLVEYTTIPVYAQEVVITLDSEELFAFPFLFMTGHKLVRFNERERVNLARFTRAGGLLFSDDCNHDIDGLYAKSFEEEMRRTYAGEPVNGRVEEYDKIGDPLTLVVGIDQQDIYGMHISDCSVKDGLGWSYQMLINSDG